MNAGPRGGIVTETITEEQKQEVITGINEVLEWIKNPTYGLPKRLGREVIEAVLHDLRHNAEKGEIPE